MGVEDPRRPDCLWRVAWDVARAQFLEENESALRCPRGAGRMELIDPIDDPASFDGFSHTSGGRDERTGELPVPTTSRSLKGADDGHVFLAAVTGFGLPADQKLARQAGFDCHLVKPVHPNQVNALLRELGAK